jgi:pyruvate dehydrogenase E1 component alpha subunit
VTVDGNDVFAVYDAVKLAIARARKGKGPSLIECKTYRIFGHEEGDEETYKTKSEIEEWSKKDAIKRLQKKLVEDKVLTTDQMNTIEKEVLEEIENAVNFAKESPFPAPEETLEDVYA